MDHLIKNLRRPLSIILSTLCIVGCTTIDHKPMVSSGLHPQKIVVLFDGTNNDEKSDTNIKKLHDLISLQADSQISTIYITGVGTNTDVLGMAAGVGIAKRIQIAYEFVWRLYQPNDKVYIFGFSRGAYAARILSSILYHAGLPKNETLTSQEISEAVYKAVKSDGPIDELTRRASAIEKLTTLTPELKIPFTDFTPVDVEVLGLWDTVEALGGHEWGAKILHKLGISDFHPDIDTPNPHHGDKLCNVHHAYHAVSIDDDREWVFTPLLLTRAHLFQGCNKELRPIPMLTEKGMVNPNKLREVWFSGAHSDVGGGYKESRLNGVSLNWMINTLQKGGFGLLPAGAKVPEDPHGTSHDPEGELSLIYHAQNRNIIDYALSPLSIPGYRGRICVHSSVFERRKYSPPSKKESSALKFDSPGIKCIAKNNKPDGTRMIEASEAPPCMESIEVVDAENCYSDEVKK